MLQCVISLLGYIQPYEPFSKILGGSELHVQNFLKLCQKLRLIMLLKKVDNVKNFTVPFLNYKPLML